MRCMATAQTKQIAPKRSPVAPEIWTAVCNVLVPPYPKIVSGVAKRSQPTPTKTPANPNSISRVSIRDPFVLRNLEAHTQTHSTSARKTPPGRRAKSGTDEQNFKVSHYPFAAKLATSRAPATIGFSSELERARKQSVDSQISEQSAPRRLSGRSGEIAGRFGRSGVCRSAV